MAFDFDTPIPRRGTWSARWSRYGEDVIPLWVADTDFLPPEPVRAAMARRVAHGILGYSIEPPELREAIVARMLRLYGWRVAPEWIVFLPGVVPGLHLAARHLTKPEEHILLPTPVYHHVTGAAVKAPRAHSKVPLVAQGGRWVMDEDAMARLVQPSSRLFLLCNPQNPGGTIYTRAELERIAAFAAKHGLVLCSDEIHADLLLDQGKPHVPIASLSPEVSRRTVTLMAPNKTFNFPGAGLGYAIIEDAALREAFSADHHGVLHGPSVIGYDAALAAYSGACEAWLEAQLAYLRANRDAVEAAVAAIPGLSMLHTEATYLAWIDASGWGEADPYGVLLKEGLATSPGAQFGAPRFFRLNFGTQRALLDQALERIRTASTRIPRG